MGKLIYIYSIGHSGSTLLDLLIGTLPGVFSAGELQGLPWKFSENLKENSQIIKLNLCSCGKNFYQCTHWSQVINALSEHKGIDLRKNPFKFDIAILNNPVHASHKKIHQKQNSLKKRIYKKIVEKIVFSNYNYLLKCTQFAYKKQLKYNWLLFDTIEKKLGYNYIVDSSKNLLRLILLYSYRPSDVYLIINRKDYFNFIASNLVKRNNENISKETIIKNSISTILRFERNVELLNTYFKEIPKIETSYEEFAQAPKLVRRKFGEFIGYKSIDDHFQINTNSNHLIGGNPMRFKGKIDISYEDIENKLSTQDIKLIKSYLKTYNL